MKNNRSKTNLHKVKFCSFLFPILVLGMLVLFFQNGYSQAHSTDAPAVDSQMQAAIIDSVAKALKEVYVFPDVAGKMADLVHDNLKAGEYKKTTNLTEFTEALTRDLQKVSRDRHLRVRALPPRQPNEPAKLSPEEEKKRRLAELRADNFGFKKVEILPGNIGYVDFRYFADASLGGATAIAVMNFLAHTEALIFDLRQNGGGSPSMIQLMSSYLFEEPVHLNNFYIRKSDTLKQFWTQSWVEGPRMTTIPVYVLTSSYTFSGAEEFTYNLKNLKRGTIIGEATGGGAHPVEFRTFENLNVGMSLPFGRAVNPITGTNWEGTGVEPDIKVPADEALTVAQIEAIKKLIENPQNEPRKPQLEWVLKYLEVQRNPVKLSEKVLKDYVGVYGPRKIWVEKGTLFYKRENRPKYKLTPMGDDTFIVEGLDYFRLRFKRNQSGAVTEIIGLYNNGETDSHQRTGK